MRGRTHKGVEAVVDDNWVSKKGTCRGCGRKRVEGGGWRVGKVRRRVVVRSGGAENIREIKVRTWRQRFSHWL